MTWLRAAHNQLAPALGAVAGMSQLRVLDVSFNALRSFDGLGSLCLVLCCSAAALLLQYPHAGAHQQPASEIHICFPVVDRSL